MIKIISLLDGTNMAVTQSQAEKVVELLKKESTTKMELDFSDMEIATTAFINVIFDYFLKEQKIPLSKLIETANIVNANDFIKFAFSSSYKIAKNNHEK